MLKISAKIPFFFLGESLLKTDPKQSYWERACQVKENALDNSGCRLVETTNEEQRKNELQKFTAISQHILFYSKDNSIRVEVKDSPIESHGVTPKHIEDLTQMATDGHEIAARIIEKISPDKFKQLVLPETIRQRVATPYLSSPTVSKEKQQLQELLNTWINKEGVSSEIKQHRTNMRDLLIALYDLPGGCLFLGRKVESEIINGEALPPGLHLLNNISSMRLFGKIENLPADFTFPPRLNHLEISAYSFELLRSFFPKTLKTINGISLALYEQLFHWIKESTSESIKKARIKLCQKIQDQPVILTFDAIKLKGIPPKIDLMTFCRNLILKNYNLSLFSDLPPNLDWLRLKNCTSAIPQEILPKSLVPFLELQEHLVKWIHEANSEDIKNARSKLYQQILTSAYDVDLIINVTALDGLPPKMDLMTSCRDLTLENCNLSLISTLPPNLNSLRLVYCTSTLSQEIIPKSLTELSLFQTLALDINIYELTKLENLYLNNGNSSAIKLDERIRNLTKLHKLSLGDLEFELLSESMRDVLNLLPKLSKLCLFIPNISPGVNPAINKLKQIKSLRIRSSFEFPPSFLDSLKDMPALTRLDLSMCNKIGASLAEVGALTQLHGLDLYGAGLNSIPDELANLSSDCTINIEDNPLSLEEIERFRALCEAKRLEDPERGPTLQFSIDEDDSDEEEQSLEDVTASWQKRCRKSLPAHCQQHPFLLSNVADCIADFKDGEKKAWSDFLIKLKKSSDYKSETLRPGILLRVAHMFQGARTNEKFRGIILTLLKNSVNRCHDKPVQALNQIEILWRIHCEAKELDSTGVARLVLGLHRLELLHAKARERIKELRLGDEVETFLRYETALREKLALPVSIESMLHAEASGIDEAILEKDGEEILAVSSTIDDRLRILLESSIWRKQLKRDPDYQQKKTEIIERAQRALEKLADDGTYYARSQAVQAKQKEALQELNQVMTKAFLEKPQDLFVNFLSGSATASADTIQVIYGPELTYLFLTSNNPYYYKLTAAADLGQLIPAMSFTPYDRQGISVTQEKMPAFLQMLGAPAEIAQYIEARRSTPTF